MKEVKQEYKTYTTVYEAVDGTQFSDKEECRKYEQSAKCVLRTKFQKLIVGTYDGWELMGGDEDHDVYAVAVNSADDIKTVLQLLYLDDYCRDEEMMSRRMKFRNDTMETALKEKDYVLIGENCDGDIYFLNTRNHYVNNLLNIDKKDDGKDEEEPL